MQRRFLPAVSLGRVSSVEQAKGWSVKTQLDDNRAYASELGFEIVKEFTDEVSGARTNRDGLAAAIDFIDQNSIKALFIWKMDRIYRTVTSFCSLRHRLQSKGVEILPLSKQTSASTQRGGSFVG